MEAAFFDLDKTIISRSSSLALGRPLYRAGMVSRGQLMRGAYAQLVYLLIGADESRMDKLKEGMLQRTPRGGPSSPTSPAGSSSRACRRPTSPSRPRPRRPQLA